MARPALLIGLGGTGQWVLTYVKKELLDYTKGEGVPKEVRLVAFDTSRPIDENKSNKGEEEPIVVEGVRLGTNEFYHLGGNIERIVREIAQENLHPHIGAWLQAKTYLARLGAGQYMLGEGAGQMRPFGRMAVFKDLGSNPQNSTIFGTIRTAIQDIRQQVTEKRSLEISIIASLAGGTGAGMAIDVAHIVRTIAEDAIGSKNFIIRGFFVLPRVFHLIPGGDSAEMRSRAFAAIRELSRFITVFGDREYPMIYNPHLQFREDFQKPVKKRLFDLCYLVDAHRERNPLEDVEPKFGVFPSIADAILAFLDEKSGQEHTEHVNNMMPLLTRGDDVAYFSAIGTYAFDLPVREIAEENACELAIDFLSRLVKPEFDKEGRVNCLSSLHNPELPGKRGSDLVDSFMKDPGSIEGLRGTLFLSQAANILDQKGIRNNQLLEQAAGRTNVEWLTFMEPEDTSEEFRELRTEVRTILENSLSQEVKPSRDIKEKPEFGCDRIEKDVEQYMIKYLGRKQPDGSTTGGKFREGLDRYQELQLKRFRESLGGYCLKLLNGTTETEPETSKSAKLGFVQEFLSTLSRQLEAFCKFMERVREIRQKQGRLPQKRQEAQDARSRMFEDRKKSGFFQDRADAAQKEFIQLMQEQVELEKDDMVFDYVFRIALQFRDHSISLNDVLAKWTTALALGSAEQMSLYEALQKNLQQVKAKRQRAANFSRVRKEETDEEFEKDLYDRFSKEELADIFRSLKWKISGDGKTVSLEVLEEPLMAEKVRERDWPAEHNVGIILKKTRSAFQRLIKDEAIAQRLMDRYKEEDLADMFYENGSPLVNFSSAPRHGQHSNFLAVRHGVIAGDEPYFRKVVDEIGYKSGARGKQAKLVQYEGAHKCILIYTIDVIDADSLISYEELYSAYRQFVDDRRLLHNFPAEVNAVYYEQKVRDRLGKVYRMFNPRIVFMLEYKDWVRQFTRCKVYNLVKLDKDEEGKQFWGLHLSTCEYKGKKYQADVIRLTPEVAGKADFLQAMDTFIFKRKDYRWGIEISIDPNHLIAALIDAEKVVGNEAANIQKIQSVIDEGFVHDFSISDVAYERDLGDLMHVILLDEIDRLSGLNIEEIVESTEQETETYHMVLISSSKEIAVGQRFKLRVEIQPGEIEQNSFKISKDIPLFYCFVNSEGLRLVGDGAASILREPGTGQPFPVEFEIQGHVRGKQEVTVELFIQDHQSRRLSIIKSGMEITVFPPKPGREMQPILPQIDIQAAPQPDIVLHVESNINGEISGLHYPVTLTYRLTSYLPGSRCKQEKMGETVLDSTELLHFRSMLKQTLLQASNTQPEDVRRRMLSLGTYLFDRLFPQKTTEGFHTVFWKIKDRIATWLVVEDTIANGINWIPWELVVPYRKEDESPPAFLGEKYRLSRWVNGLGATLYGEFPFGDTAVIDYKSLTQPGVEQETGSTPWQKLLNAQRAIRLQDVVKPGTPAYAVHLIRYTDLTTRHEIVDRNQAERIEVVYPEDEARQGAKLDLKLKRPLVTFSILNQENMLSETAINEVKLPERVMPFLRAGASAVICPWWPTTEAADQIYWHTFYDLLGRGITLGEAALRARLTVRDEFPHLTDWLAYTLFGDPRAHVYWPEESQGYTALECLNPGNCLAPGKTYSFRASISAAPPIGFKGRLVKTLSLPEEIHVLFLVPGLQETVPEAVPMDPVDPGGTLRIATQQFNTPQYPGKYPLVVQFFADGEHIKTLKLMLNVDYE